MWKTISLCQNPASNSFSGQTINVRIRSDVCPSFIEYGGGLYVSDGKGAYVEMLMDFHSFSAAEVILLNTEEEED